MLGISLMRCVQSRGVVRGILHGSRRGANRFHMTLHHRGTETQRKSGKDQRQTQPPIYTDHTDKTRARATADRAHWVQEVVLPMPAKCRSLDYAPYGRFARDDKSRN